MDLKKPLEDFSTNLLKLQLKGLDSLVTVLLSIYYSIYFDSMTSLVSKYPTVGQDPSVLAFHQQISKDFDLAKNYFRSAELAQVAKGAAVWKEWEGGATLFTTTAKQSTSQNYSLCAPFYEDYFSAIVGQATSALLDCTTPQSVYISTTLTINIITEIVKVAIFSINVMLNLNQCALKTDAASALSCVYNFVSISCPHQYSNGSIL